MMRTRAIAILAAGLLAGWATSSVCRAGEAPAQLDEVLVTGERTGPDLWHVHRGRAQLWILGSITPLPKGITWRSKQVEQVLDGTGLVLVPKPLEIGIVRVLWLLLTQRDVLMVTGGKRLRDVLPAGLYARFAVLRDKYTGDRDKWERYRPLIAAAFLQHTAFGKVGLSEKLDLGAAVRTLAKKHRVHIEEIKIAGVGDFIDALKSMPPATEWKCVTASLVTIETGLPRLIDRAQAWATGNLERIESLPEPAEVDACLQALDTGAAAGDLVARVRRTWLEAMERSVQGGNSTLAVVNMDLLLGRTGLLERLRADGYEVDAP